MRRAPLAFALFASSSLLACPGDDAGETDAVTTGSTGAGTAVATSTGEPATSTGSSGPMATTGSSDAPADSSSGGGPSLLDACTAACERLVECEVQDVPNCGIPCANIEGTIAGCEAEYLAQQTCVTALSCADLQAWADAMMTGADYPCENEDDAFQGCLAGGASEG